MPSSEKTTNLKLSKFKPNDCPSWLEDYNSDMASIDKLLPPGSVLPYAGCNAPAGYLIANG